MDILQSKQRESAVLGSICRADIVKRRRLLGTYSNTFPTWIAGLKASLTRALANKRWGGDVGPMRAN